MAGPRVVRILALVPYPIGRVPGQRYRIEQWEPLLRREGIEIVFSPFLPPEAMDVLYQPGHLWVKSTGTVAAYARRLLEALRPGDYHAAFVFREAALLGNAWPERLVARRLPLVLDFDDAIYLPNVSEANSWVLALKSTQKLANICRVARHVTAGNETLASYAASFSPHVTVIPSTIDTDAYRVPARAENPRPIVGWTGSTTTVAHLLAIEPALRALRGLVDYELRVIGAVADLPGLDVRSRPWRAETEVGDLAPVDVGLMPLPDDEWSRGKCGMKALQYMGLGIPPVVSPVGVNRTIVEDGANGFHAGTTGEWVDRIARLLRDPALRARIGAAARRTVEERYSARVEAPLLAAFLREVAGS